MIHLLLPNVYVKSRSSVHIASTIEHLQTLDPPQRVAQQPPPPRPPPRPLLLLARHAAHGLVKQVAQPDPAQRRALVVVAVESLRNILRLQATVYSYLITYLPLTTFFVETSAFVPLRSILVPTRRMGALGHCLRTSGIHLDLTQSRLCWSCTEKQTRNTS